MSYTDDLSEILRQTKLDCEAISNAVGVRPSDASPLGRICQRLIECLEGAILVAPFKAGDHVRLLTQPVITDKIAPGWRFAKSFLVEGALATVHAMKFDSRGFGLLLQFDRDAEPKALFYFTADQVEAVSA